MLFIDSSAIGESIWVLTGDDHISSEASVADDVDLESRTDFLESLNTTTISDPLDCVEELKRATEKKIKKGYREDTNAI